VGVYTGYSALAVALALPDDGRIIACDINEEWTSTARRYWREAGVDHKIDLRLAPALVTLDHLIASGQASQFDFVFIDADKISYPEYLAWALRLTRIGSIIAADNCVRKGMALRAPEQVADQSNAALAEYNKLVANNPRLLSLVLAMDDDYTDGFNIAVVRASEGSSA